MKRSLLMGKLLLSVATLMGVMGVVALSASPTVGQTNPDSSPQQELSEAGSLSESTVNGRLDGSSDTLDDGSYFNVHTFEGMAGEQIILDLTSSEFDAYLILLDPEGNKITEDDDGGDGKNARISATLPTTGTYAILVNTYQAEETGDYTLSWREATETELELAEAEQLNQQAFELYNQGQYADAIPLAERALAIREKALGAEHPLVATSLNNLALLYQDMGNYQEAEPLYQRALAIYEKALGAEHPLVATSLNNLALLYQDMGNYQQAESLYQRALAIQEKVLGKEHPHFASSLNSLASLYQAQGNYSQAEPLLQRALAIQEKVLGKEHPHFASSLNSLAVMYLNQGNFSQAEPLFQRALAIQEKVLGADHPHVATSLNNLAALYWAMGNYQEAEPLLQRALAIQEKVLGLEHPDVADSLNRLALLYQAQGNFSQAEPLFQRALAIQEKVLGLEHPDVATSLDRLASLYQAQGNYSRVEPLLQRALAIQEKVLGLEHPDVATSLNSLASLYQAQRNYSQAEPLLQRALAIQEKVLGKEHPHFASSLNSLAVLYYTQGNSSQAEPLFQRALAIREKVLGQEHPDVATSLNSLAVMYLNQGNFSQAEPLFQRALAIDEKVLGKEHPDVATSLNNLSVLYWAQGDIARTLEFKTRVTNIQERNLALNLTTGSETQKRAYMVANLAGTTDGNASLHIQSAPNNSEAARLALTTILQRKGRVLDSLTDSLQTLRQNLTPEDQTLLDQLADTRSQLAALFFNKPDDLPLEQYQQQVATLKAQAEQYENALSRRSAEFRAKSQPVTIEAVQQLIPPDAALVELVLYYPVGTFFTSSRRTRRTLASLSLAPRYAAYILHSTGDIQWVDLGEAAPINQAVSDFRKALQSPSSDVQPVARALDAKLMQPIRQKLGDTNKILLSPDSQLNLIPFAALVDENDNYLVENYSITYLTSGRDLLKLQHSSPSQSAPLLVANPDYSNPGDSAPIACKDATCNVSTSTGEEGTRSTDSQRSTDLTKIAFNPLPGTAEEAAAIAPMLPEVTLLTESQATENAIKQNPRPQILHIATHGFFLEDIELVAPPDFSSTPFDQRSPVADVQLRPGFAPPSRTPINTENPLLRSGLALAGFNPRQSGADDGVLTALEAAGLNLYGTKLVVLSACETGVGEVNNGEGVYGLRRAFTIAGAESQVMSLWKVSDEGTKDLMVSYYQRLLDNEGRSEALRQVQLEMLGSAKYQHPYFWASFIPSGDWTPMN